MKERTKADITITLADDRFKVTADTKIGTDQWLCSEAINVYKGDTVTIDSYQGKLGTWDGSAFREVVSPYTATEDCVLYACDVARGYKVNVRKKGSLIVPITKDCKRIVKLMGEDSIKLKFCLDRPVPISIGSWVNDELFGKYYVTEEFTPRYNTSNGGYDYDLTLNAHYHRWKNKELHLTAIDLQSGKEFRKSSEWHLTQTLKEQMREVMINLQILGFVDRDANFRNGDTALNDYVYIDEEKVVKHNNALLMSYSSTSIYNAINQLAQTYECEWWIEPYEENDDLWHICFGKCEKGAEIDITNGKNAQSISVSQDTSNKGRKLYYYGAKTNLPNTYRKELRVKAQNVVTATGNTGSTFKPYFNGTEADLKKLNGKPLTLRFQNAGEPTNTTIQAKGDVDEDYNIYNYFNSQYPSYKPQRLIRGIRFFAETTVTFADDSQETVDITTPSGISRIGALYYNNGVKSASSKVRAVARVYEYINGWVLTEQKPIALTREEWYNLYCMKSTYLRNSGQSVGAGVIGDGFSVRDYYLSGWKDYVTIGSLEKVSELVFDGFIEASNNAEYLTSVNERVIQPSEIDPIKSVSVDGTIGIIANEVTYTYGISEKQGAYNKGLYYVEDYADAFGQTQYNITLTASENLSVEQWKVIADNSNGILVYDKSKGVFVSGHTELYYKGNKLESVTCIYTSSDLEKDEENEEYAFSKDIGNLKGTKNVYSTAYYITETSPHKWGFYFPNGTVYRLVTTYDSTGGTADTSNWLYNSVYTYDSVEYCKRTCKTQNYEFNVDDELFFHVPAQKVRQKVTFKAVRNENNEYADEVRYYVKTTFKVYTTDGSRNKVIQSAMTTWNSMSMSASDKADDVDITIPSVQVQINDGDFLIGEKRFGYVPALEVEVNVLYYKNGNQCRVLTPVSDAAMSIRMFDDGIKADPTQYSAYHMMMYATLAKYTGSISTSNVITVNERISPNVLKNGAEVAIESDNDYLLPYKYFVGEIDNPTSQTSIGDARLQMPRFRSDIFNVYGAKYGMTSRTYKGNTYIVKDGMAYLNGYIIPEMWIGDDDSEVLTELSVANDNIYPTAQFLVKEVIEEEQVYSLEVEGEKQSDAPTFPYIAYHLKLMRPNKTEVPFENEYVLQNAEPLKIRFLVPEDIKQYVESGEVTKEEYNTIKQHCKLCGMQFEDNYSKSRSYKVSGSTSLTTHVNDHQVVRNEDFGCKLPNDSLRPYPLDPCVLMNWNVKSLGVMGLIDEAEYKLLNTAFEYFKTLQEGNFTFTADMMSDFFFDIVSDLNLTEKEGKRLVESRGWKLQVKNGYTTYDIPPIGQRVVVYDTGLKQPKHTRVIGMEMYLDKPYDTPKLTMGETEAYSRLKQMEKQVTKLSK